MNDQYQDNSTAYMPEDPRQSHLVERYRHRQELQRRRVPTPSRPERERGDVPTWWGGRRESAALQQHHARMDGIYYATRQAASTQEAVVALEYYAFTTAIHTIDAEERELLTTDPNSLTNQVGEQLILDSAERIRVATTEIQESFRRKSLDV